MEEAARLGNYLPLPFTSPTEQESVAFLWDASKTSYALGMYPAPPNLKAYPLTAAAFVAPCCH